MAVILCLLEEVREHGCEISLYGREPVEHIRLLYFGEVTDVS